MTGVTEANTETIARAARLIAGGRIVAFPTETVYGLGADASNDSSVAAVYAIKKRPLSNPLIVHGANAAQVFDLCRPTRMAESLAAAFWPGPLTIVLTARTNAGVCVRARAAAGTVAVRVPSHPVALALLAAAGTAIAAPSANPSGRVSPTRAEHVAEDFSGDEVAMILDAGPCVSGLESSIVDARVEPARLLRLGAISRARIEATSGVLVGPDTAKAPMTPGRMGRHYSPRVPVRMNADGPARHGESYLAFGALPEEVTARPDVLNLSPTGDMSEAAFNLFAMLRRLDGFGQRIAVAPIPDTGLGEAINDRLVRAAGAKR